jgi:RHS repeat-associated protein
LLDYTDTLIKKQKFQYNSNNNLFKIENCNPTESIKETYGFGYKDYINTAAGTFAPDAWGYRQFIPSCLYSYPVTNLDYNINVDYCDFGVLTDVDLPSGGSIHYKYESNTYSIYNRNTSGQWQLIDDPAYYYEDSTPENYVVSTQSYTEFLGNGTNSYSFTVPGSGTVPVPYYINFEVTPYTSATIDPMFYMGHEGEGPIFYPIVSFNGSQLNDPNSTQNLCQGTLFNLLPGQTYTVTINAYGNNNKKGKVHITRRDNKPNPNKNLYGAGIRIKEIVYLDKKAPDYFNNIAYYNSISIYPSKQKSYSYNFFQTDRSSGAVVYPDQDITTNSRIKREPVGYKNVTVTETGNGREEFTYTSPMDYEYTYSDNGIHVVYYDYRRGLLTNKKTFTENNFLQVDTNLVYDFVETLNSTVFFDNPALNERLGWAKLIQRVTKNYFTNSTIPLITTENFTYNDAIRKISSKTISNSLGETLETRYTFHSGNSTYSQNRIAEIEKIETFRGTDLLFTKKILYNNSWNGNVSYLPSIIQGSKGTQALENSYRITAYDDYSNTIETLQENGIYVTYVWGYNKTKLVAKIENATNAQVAGALGLSNITLATEANLTSIDALRSNTLFANTMITTYAHIPLVGFSSITDPKGDKLTYEYDSFHRLKTVRDKNNKILNETDYYQAQNDQDFNSVKNIIYKTETSTSISSPTIVDVTLNKVIVDGLGRPIQQIAYQQSNSGKDIVSHIEYDAQGRLAKEYLPYSNSTSSLNYNPNAKSELLNYPEYAGQNPFTEKRYELSPLGKVIEAAAPGSDWSMANATKHTIRYDYLTNLNADNVRRFKAFADETVLGANGYYGISIVDNGFYPERELYKIITKNENWKTGDGNNNTKEEYSDKEGRIILTRTYAASVINGVEVNTNHDTYNIYDQYGNLTYVIPPAKADGSITQSILDDLCYQYRYDQRNRLVEKKLPGKQWEFITYDKLNRVVALGPTLSPFTDAPINTYGWLIAKYDIFNRKVLLAWQAGTTTSAGRKALQTNYSTTALPLNETKSISDTTINNVAFRYTSAALPTSGYDVLTVNYYDNYNYTNAPTTFTSVMSDNSQPVYYNNSNLIPKGLISGCWNRFIEASNTVPVKGELSHILYDNKARAVRVKLNNYLGGYTQLDNRIDFSGKILFSETTHKRLSADATEIYIKEVFTYTPQGRLLTHTHQIGNGAIQTLSSNIYDELGKLISKNVGNYPNGTPLQKMDYSYNIRGWLLEINKTNNLIQGTDPQDLFAMKLSYNVVDNTINNTVDALYNGNISEITWRTKSDNVLRRYGYQYDTMNRLKQAIYQKPDNAVPVTNSYNENMTYDKNGNIMSLHRNGEYDDTIYTLEIDNLTYDYDHSKQNRLLRITDNSGNNRGFTDGNTTGDDYGYDASGNMTMDKNKGIVNGGSNAIIYNHLNLPVKIIFGTTGTIEYFYNANGEKIKKVSTQGANIVTTEYLNGFQYTQTNTASVKLDFFALKEGYVKNTVVNNVNSYNYVYNYTDHLGNVRMSFGLDANNILKILEESNYYPLGLKHRNYNMTQFVYGKTGQGGTNLIPCASCPRSYQDKFNGQSWEDEMGLNITAMDYRQYDNAIGRFNGMDALAEMSPGITPYHFGNNNPNYWTDPSGLRTVGWYSSMPDWLQTMWDATPVGGTSSWNNVGGGNFECVSFTTAVSPGGPGGGGGGGGGGGTTGASGMIGAWISSDGAFHAPFVSSVGTPTNYSLTAPGAIPLMEVIAEQKTPKASGLNDMGDRVNGFALGWGIKELFIQGAVASERGIGIDRVNNISYLRSLGVGGAKYMKYVKGVGQLASIVGTALSIYEIREKGIKNATIRDWTDLGVNAAGTVAVLFMASNPIGWGIGAACLAYSVGTAIYDANNKD